MRLDRFLNWWCVRSPGLACQVYYRLSSLQLSLDVTRSDGGNQNAQSCPSPAHVDFVAILEYNLVRPSEGRDGLGLWFDHLISVTGTTSSPGSSAVSHTQAAGRG